MTNQTQLALSSPIITISQSQIGYNLTQTVNARDLHTFLESKQDYSTWIKSRIRQYSFIENEDYVTLEIPAPQNYGVGNRGSKIDYHITLDMAKELAMVERNEKGREARRYFIECERKVMLNAERIELAHKLAAEAEVQVTETVFNAVMNGDENWQGKRYLLSYHTTGYPKVTIVPHAAVLDDKAICLSMRGLTEQINQGSNWDSNEDLLNLASACTNAVNQKLEFLKRPSAIERI